MSHLLSLQDPEPGYPEIQRVTNFWSNGTRKGKRQCFGCYWHKDGNFQFNDYLASILYADELTEQTAKQVIIVSFYIFNGLCLLALQHNALGCMLALAASYIKRFAYSLC